MNQGKRMSFRRSFSTISNPLKETMTPNTQRSTVNTGSSTSRRQSSVSLNVEIIQKVLPGLSVPIRTAAMNILDYLPLPQRLPAKAGIFAQAATHTTPVTDRMSFRRFPPSLVQPTFSISCESRRRSYVTERSEATEGDRVTGGNAFRESPRGRIPSVILLWCRWTGMMRR